MDDKLILLGIGLFAVVWNLVFLWFIFTGKLEIEYGFVLCAITSALPVFYFDLRMRNRD